MGRQIGPSRTCKSRTFEIVSSTSTTDMLLSTSLQAFAAYQPFFMRPSYTKQRALKKEILANKAELNATSSQDQFAKWAKLRRKLDKGLADLEKLSKFDRMQLYHQKVGVAYTYPTPDLQTARCLPIDPGSTVSSPLCSTYSLRGFSWCSAGITDVNLYSGYHTAGPLKRSRGC